MVVKKWHWIRAILLVILLVLLTIVTLFALSTIFPVLTYPAGYMIGFALLFGVIILTAIIIGDIFVYIFKIRKSINPEKEGKVKNGL